MAESQDEKTFEQLETKLEEKKQQLEKELKSFATQNPNNPEDWNAKFPYEMGKGSTDLEEAADEVEAYGNRIGVEHSLETQLKNVNGALERIKKGAYGTCEKCGKPISKERLEASPEATTCKDCA